MLAWPRVISNDVSPSTARPRLDRGWPQHPSCLIDWKKHGKIARARSMLITRITSSHACLLFSCASLVLIRAGYTHRRQVLQAWILMITARNGHFSSGNSCSWPKEQRRKNARPWKGIWLSFTCRLTLILKGSWILRHATMFHSIHWCHWTFSFCRDLINLVHTRWFSGPLLLTMVIPE